MRLAKIYLFLFSSSLAWSSAWGHTAIGSGGDIVSAYLEESRFRLVETLTLIKKLESMPAMREQLCSSQGLSAPLQDDCARFLLAVVDAVIQINRGPQRLEFKLSNDPVYAPVTGGTYERVSAITLTGPAGPVIFDYQRIMGRSPKLLMALLAHESGHKVKFKVPDHSSSLAYVEDNAPALGFRTGRELLDAFGLAIGNFAEKKGIIGQQFSVSDKYSCTILIAGNALPVIQSVEDTRRFFNEETDEKIFDTYVSGFGPGHRTQIGISQGNTCLSFSLNVKERSGCRPEAEGRSTEMKIYRQFESDRDGSVKAPLLLASKNYEGLNPICAENPNELPLTIEIPGLISFSCKYKGLSTKSYGLAQRYKTQKRFRATDCD